MIECARCNNARASSRRPCAGKASTRPESARNAVEHEEQAKTREAAKNAREERIAHGARGRV
eukprot:1321580-Pleurochrysis_carterae.AAC.1